jgi:hypothetical protein
MLDFSHLPYDPTARVKTDFFNNASLNNEWYTWRKPAGCKFIYVYAMAGGGGGGTSSNTVSAQRNGGGGGGGAGNISTCLAPALLIPDILFIQVGAGGITPLISNTQGTAGGNTTVSVDTIAGTLPNLYGAIAWAGGGGGGGPGGTAGGTAAEGGGGGQGAQPTPGLQARFGFNADASLHNATFAANGTAGGTGGSAGSSTTVSALIGGLGPTMGGTGGGGSGNNTATGSGAGSITLTANDQDYPDVITAVAGPAPGINGSCGWEVMIRGNPQPVLYYGGLGGGGGNNSVNPGNGGNGARGSGGGGAGGTWSLNTLAQPGNGGDGFVYITSFF